MMPPFFEIDLMVKGLKQILKNEVEITETDRGKYFGMISVLRGT